VVSRLLKLFPEQVLDIHKQSPAKPAATDVLQFPPEPLHMSHSPTEVAFGIAAVFSDLESARVAMQHGSASAGPILCGKVARLTSMSAYGRCGTASNGSRAPNPVQNPSKLNEQQPELDTSGGGSIPKLES
jgi:hypothetical protein